ncbi:MULTISPECIES: TetR/AcrR family transcriptional regulator [unclassified Burkholderia]|uniref:TetR/AcrR family transcriptional regulator n=1 Tax=unclassified Burkholderia TaxID=2613784 RepID=UPI002AB08B0E|nr:MULTISPECIES: TetR/AcrR family transcriptional regulator [unclassified Burkholderia]
MARTGRPRTFDRDAAVERAMLLFWERGFEATTLAELRTALGDLSAASFYAAFGSKETLFSECLALYMRTCGELARQLQTRPHGPREAMRAMLHRAIEVQTSDGKPKGCMAVLSSLNCFGESSSVEKEVAQARRITGAAIVECVMAGVAEGELPSDTNGAALALVIDTFLKGVAIQSRDGAPAATLHQGAELIMQLWGPCAHAI